MTVYLIADVKITDDRWVPAYAASVHDIVRKHGERERTSAAGYAHMAIERHVRVEKCPCRATSKVRKCRHVDPAGDERGIRRIVNRILDQRRRICQWRRSIDDSVELRGAGECGIVQDRHFPSFVKRQKK